MKLDLFKKQWLDIVFEGRNKSYGAYDLRRKNVSTTMRALLIGAVVFSIAVATPKIAELFEGLGNEDEAVLNTKITTVKMPPKEKPKEDLPPPPPPPPRQDQVKFVKPVVAKTEEVTEEPPKIEDIKDKNLGKETIKGNDEGVIMPEDPGDGPVKQEVVEEDNGVYNTAGVEVKPEFPGGIDKFYKYVANNFEHPEEEGFPGGRLIVSFVVEKDGSLTDIKVRDIGYGTKAAAEKLLKRCPRWTPAEQNGKKVRCSYTLPILLQANSE